MSCNTIGTVLFGLVPSKTVLFFSKFDDLLKKLIFYDKRMKKKVEKIQKG